jgi:hypothetical protein
MLVMPHAGNVQLGWPWKHLALAFVLSLAACTGPPKQANPASKGSGTPAASGSSGVSVLPPIPSSPGRSLGPRQPPTVWVGGEITELKASRLELKEASGSVLTLRRLGRNATSFFRVSQGTWERLPPGAEVQLGSSACVETLMDGQNLLALRVFLGADCGPVA